MPRRIEATLPDGRVIELTVPSSATNEQIKTKLKEISGSSAPAPQQQEPIAKPQSIPSAAFEALGEPSRRSREGLEQIASAVPGREPTGNIPLDVAANIPKVAAETVAEVAPSFIDAPAILTAGAAKAAKPIIGAAKPVAKLAGRALSRAQQALTGVDARNFVKILDEPKTLFAGITGKAGKQFGSAVAGATKRGGASQVTPQPLDSARKTAKKVLETAKERPLNPIEALEGRQALDELIEGVRSVKKVRRLRVARRKLNNIVKTDPELAAADKAVSQASAGRAVRQVLPVSKSGQPSVLKTGIAGGAGALGGPALGAAFSPIVQGTLSSGLGLAGKGVQAAGQVGARGGLTLGAIIDQLRRQRRR